MKARTCTHCGQTDAIDRVAGDLGVDRREVDAAVALIRHGQADLIERVQAGQLPIRRALEIARTRRRSRSR
jgi:hypothetical protein